MSDQRSTHEVSDGVGGQEDRTPHDERDTQQPEARGGVSVDPLIEVGELVLQHGSVPLQIRRDRDLYQFRIRGIDRCPVSKRERYPCCGVSQATSLRVGTQILSSLVTGTLRRLIHSGISRYRRRGQRRITRSSCSCLRIKQITDQQVGSRLR